jgi:hypothetical protein
LGSSQVFFIIIEVLCLGLKSLSFLTMAKVR